MPLCVLVEDPGEVIGEGRVLIDVWRCREGTTTALPAHLFFDVQTSSAPRWASAMTARAESSCDSGRMGEIFTTAIRRARESSVGDYSDRRTRGQPTTQTRTYVYENASFPNDLTGILDENTQRHSTYGYDTVGRAVSTSTRKVPIATASSSTQTAQPH